MREGHTVGGALAAGAGGAAWGHSAGPRRPDIRESGAFPAGEAVGKRRFDVGNMVMLARN